MQNWKILENSLLNSFWTRTTILIQIGSGLCWFFLFETENFVPVPVELEWIWLKVSKTWFRSEFSMKFQFCIRFKQFATFFKFWPFWPLWPLTLSKVKETQYERNHLHWQLATDCYFLKIFKSYENDHFFLQIHFCNFQNATLPHSTVNNVASGFVRTTPIHTITV